MSPPKHLLTSHIEIPHQKLQHNSAKLAGPASSKYTKVGPSLPILGRENTNGSQQVFLGDSDSYCVDLFIPFDVP